MGLRDVLGERQRGDQGAAQSSRITGREAVWQVFCGLHNDRVRVTLRFDGADAEYSATLADVDHRNVVLQDVQPTSADALLRAGKPFELTARANGALIRAPGNVCESEYSTGLASGSYQIPLPDAVHWQQRRRSPRFALPAALRGQRARLTVVHGRDTATGMVQDLSVSGCRAVFEAFAAPLLAERDQFEDARLEIAGLLTIRARIAMRFRETDPVSGRVVCGIEFMRLAADERQRLEQFLRSLAQRAERQR